MHKEAAVWLLMSSVVHDVWSCVFRPQNPPHFSAFEILELHGQQCYQIQRTTFAIMVPAPPSGVLRTEAGHLAQR